MKTYIVIPNYIVTEELYDLAINAIKSMRNKDVFVVFVDDGSPMDCSMFETLADKYIKNEKNSGFAPTCNNGFKWIFENEKDDCYIICANNDIELYGDWLETLQFPFTNWDNVAITGMLSCKDKEAALTHRINRISQGGLLSDYMQDGGLWCSTKSVLQKIGIFDEQFIRGGYEDVDLFLRARDTFGMRIVMSGLNCYWHKQGATRWNCENNGYINNFGRESKSIELENLEKFINKWGFNPHTGPQIWEENLIWCN